MLSNRLVIGLDYGTTYTGVSFCETSDTSGTEERIQVIQDWPAAHTMIGTKEKVPSEIAYLAEGIRWGSLIPPHKKRHMWTKLELDSPKTGEAENIRLELASLTLGNGADQKRPVDIIADFLAKIKEHLLKNLDNQYGRELWMTLPITLVVTVPAVWSDGAKNRTLQAVSKAGFNTGEFPQLKRVVTATEPEAAAIYTIKSLKGSVHDEQLAVGDGFVVCDMGGGTVDLISYRVAGTEPTAVEEATVGTGDQCGGSFVDRGFLLWLENKLGVEDFVKIAGCRVDELSRTSLPPKLSRMVQEFIMTAKSGFSGDEDYYLRLPAPLSAIDDEDRGMCDGDILITASDMEEMFEFPLRRTRELLMEQFRQARMSGRTELKYVFMVGGFAESPYIYGSISAMAKAQGIQAIKPVYAWSAIVRGATVKGLESDGRTPVKFRKCRRHYGTSCSQLFDRNKHRESDSYICPYTGEKRANNQMKWLINKGQDLSTSEQVHGKIALCCKFYEDERRIMGTPLMASDAGRAPHRSKDLNVFTVAELVIDLSSVPESEFRTLYNPKGIRYKYLLHDVEIAVHSSLEFSVSVNGMKYGSITANYA